VVVALEVRDLLLGSELVDLSLNLVPCAMLLLISPLLKLFLLLLLLRLSNSLDFLDLSIFQFLSELFLFGLDGGHLLSIADNFSVVVECLAEVNLENSSTNVILLPVLSSLVEDFEVDSLGIEFIVFDFVEIKLSILWSVVDDTKLTIVPDLTLLPFCEPEEVVDEGVLLKRLKGAVLGNISVVILILLGHHSLHFFLSSVRENVGPCVLREGKLIHLLVINLVFLD
jgi:hypothetical protein